MTVQIRVQAKTDPDSLRTICFDAVTGTLSCDCTPFIGQFCAHIDAVVNAGERFMVHPDDRETADLLSQEIAPVPAPDDWQASWRKNKRWRGLPVIERRPSQTSSSYSHVSVSEAEYNARPGVVFTGPCATMSRDELKQQAIAKGWKVTGNVRDDTQILVSGNVGTVTAKVKAAIKSGVKIIDYEEWHSLLTD